MNARVSAPFQRGWCSWYHYFHAITEDALRANLKSLEAMRSEFPLDVVQLDDGFQSALGDWDTTNAKFPSGLKKIAAEIRAAGFKAGIWTAPFLAARDSRLMIDHPDWFIMHAETARTGSRRPQSELDRERRQVRVRARPEQSGVRARTCAICSRSSRAISASRI